MASITFLIDNKGQYQICDRDEVLDEVGRFVGNMWNNCKRCERCSRCRSYFFVLQQMEGVDFEKASPECWWRIYKNTNKYVLKL